MAKTIAELSGFCDILQSRIETAQQDIVALWLANEKLAEQLQAAREEDVRLREALTHGHDNLKEAREMVRSHELAAAEQRREIALLQQRLDEHIKRVETWDARRWGLLMLMAGALMSLASGLIVTLARK